MTLEPISPDAFRVVSGNAPITCLSIGQNGWALPGAVLEGLWQIGAERLIATTDDIPYEDGLHLCLLTPEGRIAEQIRAVSMYATGSFDLIGTTEPTLSFRYFDTPTWHLTVEPKPRFRLPILGDPKGIYRRPFQCDRG